jgi:hypothetical protein
MESMSTQVNLDNIRESSKVLDSLRNFHIKFSSSINQHGFTPEGACWIKAPFLCITQWFNFSYKTNRDLSDPDYGNSITANYVCDLYILEMISLSRSKVDGDGLRLSIFGTPSMIIPPRRTKWIFLFWSLKGYYVFRSGSNFRIHNSAIRGNVPWLLKSAKSSSNLFPRIRQRRR